MDLRLLILAVVLLSQGIVNDAHGNWQERLNANNDRGIWLEQNFQRDIAAKWSVNFQSQQRWGADYEKFYHQQYTGVLQYQLTDKLCFGRNAEITNISIGPGYIGAYVDRRNTLDNYHWVWENRPIVEAHVSINLSGWLWRFRTRGEYIDYTAQHYHDHGVLRQRIEIYSPWKFSCWKINPYFSNEWYFRQKSYSKQNPTGLVGVWFLNQMRAGAVIEIIPERITTALFMQWRIVKHRPTNSPHWFNIYQIGMAVNFNL